jgi:hypothetical protein
LYTSLSKLELAGKNLSYYLKESGEYFQTGKTAVSSNSKEQVALACGSKRFAD